MRYGKVTPQQIAKMAARAEAAGQLGLACHLFCLAAALDEASPLSLPAVAIESQGIERGHAILHPAPGPTAEGTP